MYYNYFDLNYINQELVGVWPGWTAIRLLGRGAFGAVYEINRNIRRNLEKAAMKVLRVPENDAEVARLQFQGMDHRMMEAYYENMVDEIQNEIKIMQRFVGNSHIVSYEDYSIRKRPDQIGWDLYIRMELLTGLPEYMKSQHFDEEKTVKLGMDIIQGLRDCHTAGIIHRDVKPENFFVNKVGNFKLGDFGVSRDAPGSHDVLSFKGTLSYMAPEVYRMLSTDERSDIYSLGMVLYECLNDNRLPFVPKNFTPYDIEAARQKRFAGEPIPAPAHGSERLKNIVLKALAEKPEDRIQSAEEMYFELSEAYIMDYSPRGRLANRRRMEEEARRRAAASRETTLLDESYVRSLISQSEAVQGSAHEAVSRGVSESAHEASSKVAPMSAPSASESVPQSAPKAAPQSVSKEQSNYQSQERPDKNNNKYDQYKQQPEAQVAGRKPKTGPSKADQYIKMKEARKSEAARKVVRTGPSKADEYIQKKAEAYKARIAYERAGYASANYTYSNGIYPQSYNPLKYFIVLTRAEAYYGCYKTINYRGQLVNVEFAPNSRAETVQVSFNGEVILIESMIR